jgi:hypothetical protein
MSKEPDLVKKVYIDGDVLAYRASFSAHQKPVSVAYDKVDDLMSFTIGRTLVFSTGQDYEVYLTGEGNFRFDVAVTHPYKGNREEGSKPEHLQDVRNYLVERHRGQVIEGQEADDQMAIEATKGVPEETVIASIDKDMLQVNCWHFNFGKNEFHFSTPEFGLKFFYTQLLTGDNVDNIKGLWRVGPAKAKKILGDSEDELELYQKVLDAYGGDAERVLENARLLWLRRYEGQMWTPPTERNEQ